jgi:isoleucyl-tRNA synthetase
MVPFITEQVWQELIRVANPTAAPSVHLTDFPVANTTLINRDLNKQVAMTRRVVELGRAARAESGVKIRQPLQRALISASGWASLPLEMKEQISDELNVIDLADIADADGDLVDVSIKANFKSLGAKYGKSVQDVAKLVAVAEPVALVKTLRAQATTTLGEFEISLDDLVVTEVPKSGWMVASHDGESVALDLELTPTLIAAGHVREVIRAIQERRKSDGFDISDRISITWNATDEIAVTIESSIAHISEEVLATSSSRDNGMAVSDAELGFVFAISKA